MASSSSLLRSMRWARGLVDGEGVGAALAHVHRKVFLPHSGHCLSPISTSTLASPAAVDTSRCMPPLWPRGKSAWGGGFIFRSLAFSGLAMREPMRVTDLGPDLDAHGLGDRPQGRGDERGLRAAGVLQGRLLHDAAPLRPESQSFQQGQGVEFQDHDLARPGEAPPASPGCAWSPAPSSPTTRPRSKSRSPGCGPSGRSAPPCVRSYQNRLNLGWSGTP